MPHRSARPADRPRDEAADGPQRPRRAARGVGAVLDRVVAAFVLEHPAALDYVALVPERLWADHGRGAEASALQALADVLAERYPVVLHGTGLSIGSAMPLDAAHLARVSQTAGRYGAMRYSEALTFSRQPAGPGRDSAPGFCLPLPCDEAVLEGLVPRVRRAVQLAGLPLLLENGVRQTAYVDEDMPAPVFLSRLAAASGCGLLLDLHRLDIDWRRNGTDPEDTLAGLDLRLVREIRMVGGAMLPMLCDLVPRCPALEGITFERDALAEARPGPRALQQDLDALTAVWALREMEARDTHAARDCHAA